MSKLCKDCVFFYREHKWFGRHKDMCNHPKSVTTKDKFRITGDPKDRYPQSAENMRYNFYNCGSLGSLFEPRDKIDMKPSKAKPKRPGRIY